MRAFWTHISYCLIAVICSGITTVAQQVDFIPNHGQFHDNVKYRCEIPAGNLYLESTTWTYAFYDAAMIHDMHHAADSIITPSTPLQHHAYRMQFVNTNPNPTLSSTEKQPHYYNFYLGGNSEKWASEVPAFAQVDYTNLYPNIDASIYGNQGTIKYDFIVQPNGDPSDIAWNLEGADRIWLEKGVLKVATSLGEVWEEKPYAFQRINGVHVEVNCTFTLDENRVAFEVGTYDKSQPLIIDPVLIFSTYSGSASSNFGYTATFDGLGYLYSGSTVFGSSYPTTSGAFQSNWNGGANNGSGTDVAITKYDTTGQFMIYSTYLGGAGDELPHSLVVNENDELYIMGTTGSSDFPVTTNALDTSFSTNGSAPVNLLNGLGVFFPNSSDIFISKFNSGGSQLLASTYLGGSQADGFNTNSMLKYNYADEVRGEIDIDKQGNVIIASTTKSPDIPIVGNTVQAIKPGAPTNQDGYLAKLSPSLDFVVWSTYWGGTGGDAIYSVAVAEDNSLYITGGTNQTVLTTNNAFDQTQNGDVDAYVSHIGEFGDTLLNGSYFGSAAYDQSYFVELDRNGRVYLLGQTEAPGTTLIYNALYNTPNSGQFIVKFKPELDTIVWSTVFGSGDGDPDISPTAFLVDVCSSIYLSGWGSSIVGGALSTNGLDTAGGAFQGATDSNDFYLFVMSDDASTIQYGSFIGGSAHEHVDGGTSRFDKKGKIYQSVCAGCPNQFQGASSDFPTLPDPGAVSNINGAASNNGCNAASFKMDFNVPFILADFQVPESGCAPFSFSVTNLSLEQTNTSYAWDFGDGTTSTNQSPSHTYSNSGTYTIQLILSDPSSCNLADTLVKQVSVLSDTAYTIADAFSCNGEPVQIGITNNPNPNVAYKWIPSTGLSDSTVSDPIITPSQSQTYTLVIANGVCSDTVYQPIQFDTAIAIGSADSLVCSSDGPVDLIGNSFGAADTFIWSNFSDFSDTLNTVTDSIVALVPQDSSNTYYLQTITPNGCIATDSVQVTTLDLQTPLTAELSGPDRGCSPFNASFTNTTVPLSNTSYLWTFHNGDTTTSANAQFTYTNAGLYTVQLIATDTAICNQRDTLEWDIFIDSDSNYTLPFLVCYDQETPIGITPDTSQSVTYTWFPAALVSNPDSANPTIQVTADTSLLLIVDDGYCLDSIQNEISVDPVFAETDSIFITCSDQLPVTITGTGLGTAQAYIWSSNRLFSDTLNAPSDSSLTFSPQAVDTHYFAVETNAGCIAVDSMVVVVSDEAIALSPDTLICLDDTVSLSAQNLASQNVLDYTWAPVQTIIGSNQVATVTVAPQSTTTYRVIATNDSGCVYTDSINVQVSSLTQTDVAAGATQDTIAAGFSTTLFADPVSLDYAYSWSPAGGLTDPDFYTTDAAPTQTTTYSVQVTDEHGVCAFSTDVTIYVVEVICGEPEIFIPSGFTPNGDGQNDKVFVRGNNIASLDFKIFNRWGELVFETTNQNQGWDGTFRGNQADSEVFVYYLDVICIDGQQYQTKGDITLIR